MNLYAGVLIWDQAAEKYVEPEGPRCGATWATTVQSTWDTVSPAGSLCGREATEHLGDAPLCDHHFKRVLEAARRKIEDQREEYLLRHTDGGTRRNNVWNGRPTRVYFAERDGFVKIGHSTDVESRMKAVANGSAMIEGISRGPMKLLATMPGNRIVEGHLHIRFAHCNVGGEWFLPDAEMWRLIERLQRRNAHDQAADEKAAV